nr:Uncharacterized iron-regulated protein (PiuC) [uncultured Mediterranean phage uvMED]
MKHPYYIIPEVLPEMITEDIKNIVLNYEEIEGGVGGNVTLHEEAKVDSKVRRCKQRWLPPNANDTKQIHTLCTEIFEEANRRCFSVNLDRIFNMFYAEYRAEDTGYYDKHKDSNLGFNGEMYDRKLSMTIQLSDSTEYEGGDFVFYDELHGQPQPDKELIRQKGAVFVFPSFIEHGVKPVTKGVRKCLIAFMEGPQWK